MENIEISYTLYVSGVFSKRLFPQVKSKFPTGNHITTEIVLLILMERCISFVAYYLLDIFQTFFSSQRPGKYF